ncbi:long-chain-fatty-acid--CoA ligase [Rhodococcus zopfii]|uniref:long-chain-fatty-acid--CoA ligase n=1 Tax=Rhodococcus zopfii TaxID=43772 RepID=UPI00352830C1
MLNLSVLLEDSARRYPDRVALIYGTERLTYADLNARADRIAALLVDRGIRPGDRIALTCPNIPAFPAVYYGILKAGGVVVPLNTLLKSREIAYHLDDSGAVLYFCFEGTDAMPTGEYGLSAFSEADGCREILFLSADSDAVTTPDGTDVQPGIDLGLVGTGAGVRCPTDTAVVLYTSGTTGRPKGAELTHANMVLNALTANRLFDSNPLRHDTYLLTLPLFHSFGQTVTMNAGLSVGATLVLMPRFEAKSALDLMLAESVTVFAGVPTMYWALLGAVDESVDVKRIARTLRRAISGGAALPVDILTRFAERFGVGILEGYGLSETSPLAMFSDPEQDPRPGSIGIPVWGIEAMLIDEHENPVAEPDAVGELALRGHNIMKGYLDRPEATAEVLRDGWFRTGDLARRDDDGFYYIVDRAKDLIVRGGFNVYPREIEEVLMSHPSVSLAAVVGTPDERHGEEVKAFVVPEPGERLGEAELIDWCKEQMAAYKYPRRIEFMTVLPMTATGKILKRALIESAPSPRQDVS